MAQQVSVVDFVLTVLMLIVAALFIAILYVTIKNLCTFANKLQQILNKYNQWIAISTVICITFYALHSFMLVISFIALLIEREHITSGKSRIVLMIYHCQCMPLLSG
eukprot:554055_1